MTSDLNFMEYIKVMVNLVTIGKLKISEKSIFRLVLTLKPYISECCNSLWVNISTDTV